MTQCRNCGAPVPADARVCPACLVRDPAPGAPAQRAAERKRARRRLWLIFAGLILLAALFAVSISQLPRELHQRVQGNELVSPASFDSSAFCELNHCVSAGLGRPVDDPPGAEEYSYVLAGDTTTQISLVAKGMLVNQAAFLLGGSGDGQSGPLPTLAQREQANQFVTLVSGKPCEAAKQLIETSLTRPQGSAGPPVRCGRWEVKAYLAIIPMVTLERTR